MPASGSVGGANTKGWKPLWACEGNRLWVQTLAGGAMCLPRCGRGGAGGGAIGFGILVRRFMVDVSSVPFNPLQTLALGQDGSAHFPYL